MAKRQLKLVHQDLVFTSLPLCILYTAFYILIRCACFVHVGGVGSEAFMRNLEKRDDVILGQAEMLLKGYNSDAETMVREMSLTCYMLDGSGQQVLNLPGVVHVARLFVALRHSSGGVAAASRILLHMDNSFKLGAVLLNAICHDITLGLSTYPGAAAEIVAESLRVDPAAPPGVSNWGAIALICGFMLPQCIASMFECLCKFVDGKVNDEWLLLAMHVILLNICSGIALHYNL